ncbi:hypothetical protein GCM10027614_44250 [Micromonospora vulcania]
MLRADQLGELPTGIELAGPADQHQPGPMGQPGAQTRLRLVGAEHDQWGGLPASTGGGRIGGDLDFGPAGGGEPE